MHKRDFSSDKRLLFVSAIAICVGALATLSARVLLDLINFFTNLFFFQRFSLAAASPAHAHLGIFVIAIPAIGGLIVGLIARYGSDKIRGHGIPEALEAILFGRSKMSVKVAVLKPLSSGIVIGSGGPFGAEGPIIMTGGALGSLIAQNFSMTAGERKALLVAGACAGMTAVFGTPVAAVLLAVELLLFELRPRSLLPVALACAVAAFVRPLLMTAGPLFPITTLAVHPNQLLSCVIAGLLCGILSALLTLSLYKVEDLFSKLPIHWMWWPAIGGVAIGIGGYIAPRALGVGYDVIGDLLNNRLILSAVVVLLAVKIVIWVIALGSGTSGGVLAPLLMMGAGLGIGISGYMVGGDPRLWALVCMAGVLGGVMRAPLTAIVFAFGLTGDSNAFLPLLLTCAVSYGFTVLTMPRSILTEKIARRGYHVYREYAVDPLERYYVADVMTSGVQTIEASRSLEDLWHAEFGESQKHRAFPVVERGELVGLIDRTSLLALSKKASKTVAVGDVMERSSALVAYPGETCRAVATRMAAKEQQRLTVVESPDSMRVMGIVSRSDLIKPCLDLYHEEIYKERVPFLKTAMAWSKAH